jgi:hypothetical protein
VHVQSCVCLVLDDSAVVPILRTRVYGNLRISVRFVFATVLRVYHGDSLLDA